MAHAQALERREPGGVGLRFLQRSQPSLEAQLCNLADEIAYNAHDIDDGVRSGLITFSQLQEIPLFARHMQQSVAEHPQLTGQLQQRRLLCEVIRRMLSAQVYDVIDATQAALQQAQPDSVDAVRISPPLVRFSDAMRGESILLKQFLHRNLYRHPQVMETTTKAQQMIRDLFAVYCADPGQMKPRFAARAMDALPAGRHLRVVADYIAGMTDRLASREHERLLGARIFG